MPSAAGPTTHYELFAGLRDAGVGFLVTGATALTLHGVPRLTPDIDLVVDPDPLNLERLDQLLATWGYGEAGPAGPAVGGATVRHFAHPQAALDRIDLLLPPPEDYARQRAGAVVVTLVDVGIPLVGAAALRALRAESDDDAARRDVEALALLAAVQAGEQGSAADTGREQIRKFSRWSVAARLDWLLAAARLAKGMSPEARPMTRGLLRRNPWTRRRG